MLRFRLWAVVFIILGVWSSVPAQETPFTFWIDTHTVPPFEERYILLDEQGRLLDSFDPYNDTFTERSSVISPEGRRFALVGLSYQGNPVQRQPTLLVYDTATDALIYQDQVEHADSVSLHFIDENTLAYGVRLAHTWRIIILDIVSGKVLHRLLEADLSAYELNISTNYSIPSPWIYTATNSSLVFVMRDQERDLQTFIWHYEADEVVYLDDYLPYLAENFLYGRGVATPLSSYVLAPIVDDRLLFAMHPEDPYQQYPYAFEAGNAVHVLDISTGQYFPIYTTTEGVIRQVFPVQNGERLLVSIADDYQKTPHWVLLERDGQEVETLFSGTVQYIFSTPDGFIFNSDDVITEDIIQEMIYIYNTRTMTYHPYDHLQQQLDNQPPQSPDVIWASDALPHRLPEFVPIMPPLPDAMLESQPLTLRVNGTAYVTVSEGAVLNMRDQPSVNGEIIRRLQNNQRVIVLDGPLDAEGFVWWDVWLAQNVRGWVVQAVDNEVTLRPPMNDQYIPLIQANPDDISPLAVGMRVRVVSTGVNLREQIGLQASVIEVLSRNTRMTILERSIVDNGLRWWRVQTDSGTQGWIVEMTPDGEITVAPDE